VGDLDLAQTIIDDRASPAAAVASAGRLQVRLLICIVLFGFRFVTRRL